MNPVLLSYQKSYFEIIHEFFVGVTGKEPRNFSDLDSFEESISAMAEKYQNNPARVERSMLAFVRLGEKLNSLYESQGKEVYQLSIEMDACKLNLGGSSRFLKTHLNATRKSILFSDTVLIPDPIMPFLEKSREEERFNHIIPLQMAFFVLHLSDLLSSDFDILPFFIFPSFEKTKEENDSYTQEQSMQLIADVFNYYVDEGIQTLPDVIEYSEKHEEQFFRNVEKAKLFVSPGKSAGEPIADAIENYKLEMRHWRSEDWCQKHLSLGDTKIVCTGIFERLLPQFHLLEHSDNMRSNPLLCIDAQAHYYQLVSKMKNERFNLSNVDYSTDAVIKAMASDRLSYLANITDTQIVELRKTNENVAFRRELRDAVNSLPTSRLDDLGYVSSEVCSHINVMVSKHTKEVQAINDKYNAKHKYTALLGAGTLAVSMMPALAPFLSGVGFVATAGKYASDKFEQQNELKQASKSMMGVIALAKSK
ncbi:hypothetical protein LDP52_03545 [Photobacterium damselae]|uniref:hypothetical protein n=1 Tax=Photobacterium damselae TaxID=38293 RepID=UPI002341541A|nr:hypothetical protein [Photobacterium damselae]MDC4167802.1 hypothetical protein [Photobacterium damselae]